MIFSVASRAAYCLVSAFSGSVRMRTKSASVSASSSTRMRNRPLQLGDQVLGLGDVEGAAATNSTWSVLKKPAMVDTVEPSTMEEQIALHPSRETSGPWPPLSRPPPCPARR